MNPTVLEYLKGQRIGVLAIEMMDGAPHASTMHFAHTHDPFTLIFMTDRDYRKCEALFGRDMSRASFAIGVAETTPAETFQLDGEVRRTDDQSLKDIYFAKFTEKKNKADDPKSVYFTFTPTWWRYVKVGPEGKVVLTS